MDLRPSPGKAFVAAAVILVASGLGGLTLLGSGMRIGSDFGSLDVTDEHVVYAKAVRMQEGDRLLVRPELMAAPISVFTNYSFAVVPGGGRFAYVDGTTPSTVHARADGMTTWSCCSQGEIVYTREDAPGPSPPRAEIPRNATERQIGELALADPAYVDLVWVFEYREGFAPPTDPKERRVFEAMLEENFRHAEFGTPYRAMPVVAEASTLSAAPLLLAVMVAAAVATAVAAALWVRGLARTEPPQGDGAEGWLRLYDAAGTYLSSVRDLLVASLVVACLVALHVAVEGEPGPLLDIAARLDAGAGLRTALGVAVAALYAVVLAGWAVALWRVQRALNAWRRRGAAPLEP